MSRVTLKRRDLLGLLLLPALGACGVKGAIQEPKGQEQLYVYPRTYPDPKTVVPPGGTAAGTTGAGGSGTAAPTTPPPSAPVETFGSERTSTTIIKSQ